jgi:uncharacterized protein YciW
MIVDSLPRTTLTEIAGMAGGGAALPALAARLNIVEMTQAAEDAVLQPKDAGRWPHALRAALAARIARQNDCPALADRYAGMAGADMAVADPAVAGEAEGLTLVCRFMDKVSVSPRDVAARDILELQEAGVSDADIVRLCELNAFVSYQVRVIAGLRLMAESVA